MLPAAAATPAPITAAPAVPSPAILLPRPAAQPVPEPQLRYVTTITTMMTRIIPRMPHPFLLFAGAGCGGTGCVGLVSPIAACALNGLNEFAVFDSETTWFG